ncbi:hypothetical protein U4E84_00990 [Halorubrum sp. AD140]|uniref:hypothetical protein n=1 Tax=Halorubrum sp. AD140 TaxID=3050073 RepID=UPI002ACD1F30|nr:hypothetical protein [Halorubrum sp. AD140]MDZ5809929.1 hypothetical protein [Halorubrum sp. AD140]
MSIVQRLRRWRDWFPVPNRTTGFGLKRWILLDAHRLAVTGALLTVVFAMFMALATVWTFEMQALLTDTSTVQTILNTLLSGMILLVSIVVSINSIVLSHDITSIENQENRIQAAINFRRDLGALTDVEENPSDPSSFLQAMSSIIRARAADLTGDLDGVEQDVVEDVEEYADTVSDAAERLGAVEDTSGAEFAVLWKGIGFDYGSHIERSRTLMTSQDASSERFDELIEAFELFAIGKEYFKTLYYTKEVSKLSQTLLVVSLPAILFNASAIIAIDGGVLPDATILGLPPLQTFVAVAFTISIAPYLVLTAYMLRLSTVARLTAAGGIFSLK